MKVPMHFGLTSFSGPKALLKEPLSQAFDAFSSKPSAECRLEVKGDSIELRIEGSYAGEESAAVGDILSRLMKLPTKLNGLKLYSNTVSEENLSHLKALALGDK